MWILPLIGYLGMIVGFCFLTLAIASGLYYLSELVEEHTVPARRILSRLIHTIIALHLLLWLIDSLPLSLTLLSILSHLVYASNLRRFPIVKLSDPLFILSCLLVALNHWLWFRHFSDPVTLQSKYTPRTSVSSGAQYYGARAGGLPKFSEIASFFGLCVWLVPFSLFVSLSAAENVLPTTGSSYTPGPAIGADGLASSSVEGPNGEKKSRGKAMAKALVDGVRDWVSETGELMGFWGRQTARRF
ncbi:erv26 super protein [Emydomyces testavorans]|uniref:Erv26 super protein n=1 Tax=Emydomyces testavorans TaxID=2070801 RepID=A0AAF0DMG0_9EURO|nr:erv26 super protein [Emydomyces testavorans]